MDKQTRTEKISTLNQQYIDHIQLTRSEPSELGRLIYGAAAEVIGEEFFNVVSSRDELNMGGRKRRLFTLK